MPETRLPLAIPPGHRPQATSQNTGAAWWQMNGVRFTGGILRPTGGWKQLQNIQMGPGSGADPAVQQLIAWRDNAGEVWIGAASYGQIQVYDGSNGYDITPTGWVTGLPAGSTIINSTGGYGLGFYGEGIYGEPSTTAGGPPGLGTTGGVGDTVSFDTFGQTLIAMGSADGRLLQWDPTTQGTGNPMVPVQNAPPGRLARITAERYGVVIGANGDPRRVSWSDEENLTVWAPTINNQAGSLQLQSPGVGIQAGRVREGLLIWTTDDLHLLQFLGPPYAYGLVRVGEGCAPAGPNSPVVTLGVTAWMGINTWWQWRGMPVPLPSPVQDYVFNNFNRYYAARVRGYHNAVFPEITWFYPSEAATYPDSYVTWDYGANVWSTGQLARTCAQEPGANAFPLTGDANGFIYEHETGYTDNGNPRWPSIYAETGDIQLGAGDRGLMVTGMLPDATNLQLLQFGFEGQWAPGDVTESYGPFSLTRSDGIIDAIFESRAVRMRVMPLGDQDWGLGRVRLIAKPGSGR